MQQEITSILKKYTNHNFIQLTERGNTAIFAALYCTRKLQLNKKIVLYPDQGGWVNYYKYSKMLELEPIAVKTDYGVIDLKDLKEKSKNANCFIYSQPAGYYAEQPVKEIYEVCNKNKCMVIMDVTGSIGTALCDGNYADFCLGSFGEWKPINLCYGGFLSARKKEYFEMPKEIFNTIHFDGEYLPELLKKLKNLKKRYELFNEKKEKIKKDLRDFNILHKDKKGINVIVKVDNDKEKEKIINYCDKNSLEYTICPKGIFRHIKVNCDAISIEVKRLE